MIFAIAALSLELLIGVGGLVSFGHAAFLGVGAYAAGIARQPRPRHPVRRAAGRARRLRPVRARHRRHRRAHARRLFHHDHAGVRADGVLRRHLAGALRRRRRPHAGRRARWCSARACSRTRRRSSMSILALLIATYLLVGRLVASRFGRVLRGLTDNETRMQAIGFTPYPYRLTAYVIAGTHLRARRLPARQPDRVRQPRLHALAALRRADHDGAAGRHRHAATAPSSARPPS